MVLHTQTSRTANPIRRRCLLGARCLDFGVLVLTGALLMYTGVNLLGGALSMDPAVAAARDSAARTVHSTITSGGVGDG